MEFKIFRVLKLNRLSSNNRQPEFLGELDGFGDEHFVIRAPHSLQLYKEVREFLGQSAGFLFGSR